jgi:preprotein translocase subunit YajC
MWRIPVEGLTGLALPLVFLFVLYLLLIRPQQKRQKEQQRMVAGLQVGDDVVTIGGLHGQVKALTDDTMDLVVDRDGTVLRFQRSSLGRVITDEPSTG